MVKNGLITMLPIGEYPWCKEHLDGLTEEQRKLHEEAIRYFRENLCSQDVSHYDPFPEKQPSE
jgi:predicted metal-dependent phosphoesterase TrpH